MTGLKDLIYNVIQHFENSLHARYELWKLKTITKAAGITSSLVAILIIIVIASVAFFILSFGLAYWVGSLVQNRSAGFFIVGGFYVLLCVVIFSIRKKIIKAPLENFLLDKIPG